MEIFDNFGLILFNFQFVSFLSIFFIISVGISMTPINSNYCKVAELHHEKEVLVHVDFSIVDSHVMVTIAIEMVAMLLVCEMIVAAVIVDAIEDQPIPIKVIPIIKSKIMKTIRRISSKNPGADSIAIVNQNQRPMTKIRWATIKLVYCKWPHQI